MLLLNTWTRLVGGGTLLDEVVNRGAHSVCNLRCWLSLNKACPHSSKNPLGSTRHHMFTQDSHVLSVRLGCAKF